MLAQRAYKTELALNDQQKTLCRKHAGAARWAYNWGLTQKQEHYKATGTSPSAIDLHHELNLRKQRDLPWMYEVSKCAPQEALRNLDRAFANYFRRVQLKQAGKLHGKVGYPQFKTKKQGPGSFRLTGAIAIFPDAVQLPRLGRLRLKERGYLPTSGVKILSATVSEHAGHWYVSIQVEREQVVPKNTGPIVGVDLGVKALATVSDGTVFSNPHHLKHRLRLLRRLHRIVSRRQKDSKNRQKAVRRLSQLHYAVANQRKNTLHQVTTCLAKTKRTIVIEDLNVSGMLKNHHLAQVIADVGFGEFRRQLRYKAQWYGSQVILASRWEPSSKTCSTPDCGWVDKDLTLADRVFRCAHCGLVIDRDLNAAINLSKLADSSPESLNACGEGSTGLSRETQVKLPSLKQERNAK